MPHEIDTDAVRRFFDDHIYVEGFCAEVRVLCARVDPRSRLIVRNERKNTVVGWFTRSDELACELRRIRGASSYITMNPVALSGRPKEAENRLVQGRKGMFVESEDVAMWRYFMIDIDPPRTWAANQKTKNSTDEERDACREMASQIVADFGLAEHAMIGTANGAYVLVRVPDWPNKPDRRAWVQDTLARIASKYSTVRCHVDPGTYQPHQGVGIPGTYKFRGETETPDRPYRLVGLESTHDLEAETDRSGSAVLATA